jgi:formylglycine-generating enzyme required for sulfatase activity
MCFSSLLLTAGMVFAEPLSAPPMVKNVECSQGKYTQNVTVDYTLDNTVDPVFVTLDVFTNGVSVGRENIKTLSGEISKNTGVLVGQGDRSFVWAARKDMPGLLMTNVVFQVKAYPQSRLYLIPDIYMVVDVSGGPDAESYPVRYTFDGSGARTEAARTTEIWLRCIAPCKFMMGSPATEQNRDASKEALHEVTLTQPFLAGVYEVTSEQYYNVMGGTRPAQGKGGVAANSVSWNAIRGESSNWPTVKGVEDDSFMGRLRRKTGLDGFDLPTEAQWECACRAGTVTAWNNGTTNIYMSAVEDRDEELDKLAWYGKVKTESQICGLKLPNDWGLYDMHGNVLEWTLNYSKNDIADETVDPVGPVESTQTDKTLRMARGGSWLHSGNGLRSAYRGYHYNPSVVYPNLGFRLFFTGKE